MICQLGRALSRFWPTLGTLVPTVQRFLIFEHIILERNFRAHEVKFRGGGKSATVDGALEHDCNRNYCTFRFSAHRPLPATIAPGCGK